MSITWGLLRNANYRLYPRPTESETLHLGSSNLCFNEPAEDSSVHGSGGPLVQRKKHWPGDRAPVVQPQLCDTVDKSHPFSDLCFLVCRMKPVQAVSDL